MLCALQAKLSKVIITSFGVPTLFLRYPKFEYPKLGEVIYLHIETSIKNTSPQDGKTDTGQALAYVYLSMLWRRPFAPIST